MICLLVFGSRTCCVVDNKFDYGMAKNLAFPALDRHVKRVAKRHKIPEHEVVIVEGGAQGADKIGYWYAKHRQLTCITVNAEWNRLGKGAGPVRNQKMLGLNVVRAVSFWDWSSSGTLDMIGRCESANIKLRIYNAVKLGMIPRIDYV